MNTVKLYQYFKQYPLISTDTRDIKQNSIFFALKGTKFDGNQYALEAIEKGAAYAVIDDATIATNNDKMLLVENVILSLQELANYHRKQMNIPVLAITGTNGKTTSKELISAVLLNKYNLCYTSGNLNNHIGVPLSLLKITNKTQFAVIEMGANHQGEIKHLCSIAEPNYGIITNVGKAHLEGFGSFEGVLKAKSELYDFLRNNNGTCFVNADNEILISKSNNIKRITYGTKSGVSLMGEAEEGTFQLITKVLFPKGWLYIKSNLVGAYNFENIMAAACIGNYFEIDPLRIQETIAHYNPSNNRSQLEIRGTNKLILDAYNANPTSMMKALENIDSIKHDKKYVILGNMLELGEYSKDEHQKVVDYTLKMNVEQVFLVGKLFLQTNYSSNIKLFADVEELSSYISENIKFNNSLILIKGSRGTKLEKVLEVIN